MQSDGDVKKDVLVFKWNIQIDLLIGTHFNTSTQRERKREEKKKVGKSHQQSAPYVKGRILFFYNQKKKQIKKKIFF